MSILLISLLLSLMGTAVCANIFCSAYCAPNFCTGPSNGQCTACLSPFILNTTTNVCDLDPATMAIYVAKSAAFSASPTTNGNCVGYNINGPFWSSTGFLLLTFAGPVPITHNYIRFIAWFILYDQWKTNSDYI